MQMDPNFFILMAILIAAVIGVIYLTMTRKSSPALNREKFQTKWLEIENSLSRDNPSAFPMAILNADKLLDMALRERKFRGETMGERMKSANNVWKNANHVWSAHKVRNQIAHEADVRITYEIAIRSLSAFKQALKDLGAI